MIAKVTTGQGVRGLLNYIAGKPGAQLLGGNMVGGTQRELAREFGVTRRLKPMVERPVKHFSLRLPPRERLDDDAWRDVAVSFLAELGYTNTQWVVYRHTDHAQGDHIHIATLSIEMDGTRIRDSFEKRKAEIACRHLEQRHGLQSQLCSWERQIQKRAPTAGEMKHEQRTGDLSPSVRQELQVHMAEVILQAKTMSELATLLAERGVQMRAQIQSTGRVNGVTYQLRDVVLSGTQLGKSYTWGGLQKGGVSFVPERDLPILVSTREHGRASGWEQAQAARQELREHQVTMRVRQVALDAELQIAKDALALDSLLPRVVESQQTEASSPVIGREVRIEAVALASLKLRVHALEDSVGSMMRIQAHYEAQQVALTQEAPADSWTPQRVQADFLRRAKGLARTMTACLWHEDPEAEEANPAWWRERWRTGIGFQHVAQRLQSTLRLQTARASELGRLAGQALKWKPGAWEDFLGCWSSTRRALSAAVGRLKQGMELASKDLQRRMREIRLHGRGRSLEFAERMAVLVRQALQEASDFRGFSDALHRVTLQTELHWSRGPMGQPRISGLSFKSDQGQIQDADLPEDCRWRSLGKRFGFRLDRDLSALDPAAHRAFTLHAYARVPLRSWRSSDEPHASPGTARPLGGTPHPARRSGSSLLAGDGGLARPLAAGAPGSLPGQPSPELAAASRGAIRDTGGGGEMPGGAAGARPALGAGESAGRVEGLGGQSGARGPGSLRCPGSAAATGSGPRQPDAGPHDLRHPASGRGSGDFRGSGDSPDPIRAGAVAGCIRGESEAGSEGRNGPPGALPGGGSRECLSLGDAGRSSGAPVSAAASGGQPTGSRPGGLILGDGGGLTPRRQEFFGPDGVPIRLRSCAPRGLPEAVERLADHFRSLYPFEDPRELLLMAEQVVRRSYGLKERASILSSEESGPGRWAQLIQEGQRRVRIETGLHAVAEIPRPSRAELPSWAQTPTPANTQSTPSQAFKAPRPAEGHTEEPGGMGRGF